MQGYTIISSVRKIISTHISTQDKNSFVEDLQDYGGATEQLPTDREIQSHE